MSAAPLLTLTDEQCERIAALLSIVTHPENDERSQS